MLEHFLQRFAQCDHLEDFGLPIAQQVRLPALGNITGDADQPDYLVRAVTHRTFVDNKYLLSPDGSMTYSSLSIIGCPDWMIFCSSAKYCRAASSG